MAGLDSVLRAVYGAKSRKKGAELSICCPFCGDTKFHGSYNGSKDVYHCFKCDIGLSGRAFAAQVGIPYVSENVEDANQFTYVEDEEQEPEYLASIPLPRSRRLYRRAKGVLMSRAWSYLEGRLGRRLLEDCVERLEFGLCMEERYYKRIILPVFHGPYKTPVFFQARSFDPPSSLPKYRSASTKVPLFLPFGVSGELFLCEGYFDALSIGAGAVCTFGAGISWEQRKHLYSLVGLLDRQLAVTVCYDNDAAGKKAAAKLARSVSGAIAGDVYIMTDWSPHKDPGGWGRDAKEVVLARRRKASYWELTIEK